jgi:antitoxin component of MazEF toxin-antitoxin module
MAQLTIISHGDSAALVLPKKVMDSLGLSVGDTVDATLGDRQLILRPLDDAERRQLLADLTKEVLDTRSDAYRRLA